MNTRRSKATDHYAEQVGINCAVVLSTVLFITYLLLTTLAKTACTPTPLPIDPSFQQRQIKPDAELTAFYRENF